MIGRHKDTVTTHIEHDALRDLIGYCTMLSHYGDGF